jgi:hypothetical protein
MTFPRRPFIARSEPRILTAYSALHRHLPAHLLHNHLLHLPISITPTTLTHIPQLSFVPLPSTRTIQIQDTTAVRRGAACPAKWPPEQLPVVAVVKPRP